MSELSLQDILRASHTMRFTIVNTIKPQSVAEHTFNVVMIARKIAKTLDVPDDKIIKMALEHDLDEVVTGDLPTPTKRKIKDRWGVDPETLWGGKAKNKGCELENKILKTADYLDAILYLQNNAVGRHADEVLNEIEDNFTAFMEVSFSWGDRQKLQDEVMCPIFHGGFKI